MLAATVYREGNLAKSELLLRQARRDLVTPFDSALITLDLIEVLIERGAVTEASAKAKEMAALLQPFRHLPVVEGAILALVRSALTGELTPACVDTARLQVQQGRRL